MTERLHFPFFPYPEFNPVCKVPFAIYGNLFGIPKWLVKNLPVMLKTQETWVLSMGPQDPLEEEMATNSGILA